MKPRPHDADVLARMLAPALTPRSGGAFGASRASLLGRDGPQGQEVVRVRYPAGSASMRSAKLDGTGYGGAQVYLLAKPVDSAGLSYCVRFPVGFDYVKGGKLPGLFGGTVTSGRRIPNGTDGWSTRYMWRRQGAGEVYAYLPSSVDHGTSLGRGSWHFSAGVWNCLTQTVVLNAPGRADGQITVALDGATVFHQAGLVFRTTEGLHVDGVFFSTFFGGGDQTWASPAHQYADFTAMSFTPLSDSSG